MTRQPGHVMHSAELLHSRAGSFRLKAPYNPKGTPGECKCPLQDGEYQEQEKATKGNAEPAILQQEIPAAGQPELEQLTPRDHAAIQPQGIQVQPHVQARVGGQEWSTLVRALTAEAAEEQHAARSAPAQRPQTSPSADAPQLTPLSRAALAEHSDADLNDGDAMGPLPHPFPRSASPSCVSLTASSSVPAVLPASSAGASQVALGIIFVPRYCCAWSLDSMNIDWPAAATGANKHFQQSAGGGGFRANVAVTCDRDSDFLVFLLLILFLLLFRRRGDRGHTSPRCVSSPCSAFLLLSFHHDMHCAALLFLPHLMVCLPVLSEGKQGLNLYSVWSVYLDYAC